MMGNIHRSRRGIAGLSSARPTSSHEKGNTYNVGWGLERGVKFECVLKRKQKEGLGTIAEIDHLEVKKRDQDRRSQILKN